MNYIINPMWFYWLNVCDGFKIFLIVFSVLYGISIIVTLIEFVVENNKFPKWKIIFYIIPIILILLAIFIPNKTTLIEMQVAELATKSNIDYTIESIREIINYLLETINNFNS